jgi:hypothetical protein
MGSGAAALFDTSYHFLTFTNAANDEDYITLWGAGLGPVQGDETVTQIPQELSRSVERAGRFCF